MLICFVHVTQESSQSEEEYPKEKTSSHKKKRHKRSRSKSQESSASESGLRDFLWPLRVIVSHEFLHPTLHSVLNVLPLTVVYFAHFRARKRSQLNKKEKAQEGEIIASFQHSKVSVDILFLILSF